MINHQAQATKRADKVREELEALTDKKWEIRVWENCGWHSECKAGFIKIHIEKPNQFHDEYQYSCWIEMTSKNVKIVGHLQFISGRYDRPSKALNEGLQQVRDFEEKFNEELREIMEYE